MNKFKLHLNKNGVRIPSDIYYKEVLKVSLLPVNNLSTRKGSYSPICNKTGDRNTALNAIRQENDNKLIVAHSNINSPQNKCELLSDQMKYRCKSYRYFNDIRIQN